MQQGFDRTIDAKTYHADPCPEPSLSSSLVRVLNSKTPRHAWMAHPRLSPRKEEHTENDVFDLGTAAHALLLEEDRTKIMVVKADDWRKKESQEARRAAYAAGVTPLLQRQMDDVEIMAEVAKQFIRNSLLGEVWGRGSSEVAGFWSESGIWCRMLADRLLSLNDIIVDYKTTEDASPDGFARSANGYGYYVQDAFYRRGYQAIMGRPLSQFYFLAQEKKRPYACALYCSSETLLTVGRAEVERAIATWSTCLKEGSWPDYGTSPRYIEAPAWLLARGDA